MENTNVSIQTPAAQQNGGNPATQTPAQPSAVKTAEPAGRGHYVRPRTHIVENGESFVLQVELPGVARDGLEVTFENGELAIVGHRAPFQTEADLIYRESRQADFRRVFEVDPTIDATKIAAHLEQGVLNLTLPKAEAARPRRIEVQSVG